MEEKIVSSEEKATEEKAVLNEKPTEKSEEQVTKPEQQEENIQDLLVEIAKLKRKNDVLSSENAKVKKDLRERMTEQEKISLEKAEAQAAKEAEFENLKRELSLRDGTERFMDLGMEKDLAKKAALAEVDGDKDTLNTILKQHQEAQKKKIEEEFYKKLPEVNAGVGGAKEITKEQFENMGFAERTKLFRENRAEYDRLLAM